MVYNVAKKLSNLFDFSEYKLLLYIYIYIEREREQERESERETKKVSESETVVLSKLTTQPDPKQR